MLEWFPEIPGWMQEVVRTRKVATGGPQGRDMPDPWTGEIAGPYYSARGHRLALDQGQSCSLATSPAITGFRVVGIEREVPGEGTVQPPGQEYRSSRRMPVRQLPTVEAFQLCELHPA